MIHRLSGLKKKFESREVTICELHADGYGLTEDPKFCVLGALPGESMIAMPFTYSISHGIALAFISYAAIKICTGKTNVSPAIWVIAVASVISFVVA